MTIPQDDEYLKNKMINIFILKQIWKALKCTKFLAQSDDSVKSLDGEVNSAVEVA